MTLEDYKVLAAKATQGDQDAIIAMTEEAERLFGIESTSQEAIAAAKAEADKAKTTNAKLMISMYGRSDPGSPAGVLMTDKDKNTPPEFFGEDGSKLTGVQYAVEYGKHVMLEALKEE